MIRIANGQGFWGDWLEAPVRLVEAGADRLSDARLPGRGHDVDSAEAEAGRPGLGYARDFPPLIARIARRSRARRQGDRQRGRRESAGLRAGSRAARARAESRGRARRRRVRAPRRVARRRATRCATWIRASRSPTIRERILSANAYIGAFPLAEALATGAQW